MQVNQQASSSATSSAQLTSTPGPGGLMGSGALQDSPSQTDDDDDDDDGATNTSVSEDANDLVCDLSHPAGLEATPNDLACDLSQPAGPVATHLEDPEEHSSSLHPARSIPTPQIHSEVPKHHPPSLHPVRSIYSPQIHPEDPKRSLHPAGYIPTPQIQSGDSRNFNTVVCDLSQSAVPIPAESEEPGERRASIATEKASAEKCWANSRRRKSARPQWHYEGTVLDKSQSHRSAARI